MNNSVNNSMNNSDHNHEWIYREYVNRENLLLHAPYEPEMDFYSLVATGKEAKVKQYLEHDFLKKEGLGVLSDNTLHNGIYHFVITAALIARECIKAGLPMEESYSLSDFYIQKADRLTSLASITKLHDDMVLAYTRKMHKLKKSNVYSRATLKCMDYIYSNLHMRITLDILASHVKLSPSYLSKLFKKETGHTISEYVSIQKIETAENMLLYSDYTAAEIAEILAFPSQSYFTECFRKRVGTTPSKYKKMIKNKA